MAETVTLNTLFNIKSNAMLNNAAFNAPTIVGMHETATRLYQAAFELKGIKGQSAVARALNMSPQTVKNWESRGVSKQGMLGAQKAFGVAAGWIETGKGQKLLYESTMERAVHDTLVRSGWKVERLPPKAKVPPEFVFGDTRYVPDFKI